MNSSGFKLALIPTDPMDAYEKSGYTWLESYFNPVKMFDSVYALSPLESFRGEKYAMHIDHVSWFGMADRLQNIRPQVVRAYGGYWPAELACTSRIPGVPVVVSLHDNLPETISPVVRTADLVLCVSKVVRSLAISMGVPEERLRDFRNRVDRAIHHPISDTDQFSRLDSKFPTGRHILHIGRRTDQKNLDTLISALTVLPKEYSAIFVGRGDPKPYQKLANSLGVSERCFWVDMIPNHELPIWFSWCDCMCTPSRHEGFGIVFIEAAACGAAIVTSDIAPMNEYLVADQSACLVKEYLQSTALAAAIRRVCENREYRDILRQGAIRASAPFDRLTVDAQEATYYQEVLSLPVRTFSHVEKAWLWKMRYIYGAQFYAHRTRGKIFETIRQAVKMN